MLFKTGKAPGVLLKENGVVSFDIMENAKNISKIILKSSSIWLGKINCRDENVRVGDRAPVITFHSSKISNLLLEYSIYQVDYKIETIN